MHGRKQLAHVPLVACIVHCSHLCVHNRSHVAREPHAKALPARAPASRAQLAALLEPGLGPRAVGVARLHHKSVGALDLHVVIELAVDQVVELVWWRCACVCVCVCVLGGGG